MKAKDAQHEKVIAACACGHQRGKAVKPLRVIFCQWMQSVNGGKGVSAFARCYQVATHVVTIQGMKVGKVCAEHAQAARNEKWNTEKI